MEHQDFNKDFHLKLRAEFERIDQFLENFRRNFIREQLLVTVKQLAGSVSEKELTKLLKEYATSMFSCADAVADKDENYSEIRLALELESMTRAIEKYPGTIQNSELGLQAHLKAKELLIQFFPELVELSANGFRLLEKYCLLYNYEFVARTTSV